MFRLVCTVSYEFGGKDLTFRKFFKFPVEKPLDVRTKFFNTEDNLVRERRGGQGLEQRRVPGGADPEPVCCADAGRQGGARAFFTVPAQEVQPGTEVVRTLTTADWPSDEHIYLQSREVHQFLFCMTPNTAVHSLAEFRGVTSIGKLDMSWRTLMGEPGRLQTSPLTRVAPSYGDLRLLIDSIPGSVRKHEPFKVACRVLNYWSVPLAGC